MKFKRSVTALVLAAQLFQVPAWADPPLPPASVDAVPPNPKQQKEPDPGPVVTPLSKNDPAPFTGVLMSPTSVATVIAEYRSIPARIDAAYQRGKGEGAANCHFDDSELKSACEADKAVLKEDINKKAKRIADLESQHFDVPSRTLWFGLGAGAGIVFTLATVFVVVQATK